jgi:hypothetical protein
MQCLFITDLHHSYVPQLQQELDSDSQLMRCTPFFTENNPSNRIDVHKVREHAPAAAGAAVVVCGPTGFMESCR